VTPTAGDESDLVRLAQQGDREAFLKLVKPYHERVYATAVRLLGNSDDAAEVTQEAILRTFWKLQTFHGRSHYYTWLYRTALNLCYRRLSDTQAKIRAKGISLDQPLGFGTSRQEGEGTAGLELPDTRPLPRESAVQQEEILLVRQALTSLEPKDFQILVLREFEECSYEEIGRRLGLAEGTVMSRLHRARRALAERLRELGLA
jgi:RNA polymerase sigma-70 factor (ECF subfamily)